MIDQKLILKDMIKSTLNKEKERAKRNSPYIFLNKKDDLIPNVVYSEKVISRMPLLNTIEKRKPGEFGKVIQEKRIFFFSNNIKMPSSPATVSYVGTCSPKKPSEVTTGINVKKLNIKGRI